MRRLRRLWARLRYLDRCECGGIIWPWDRRVVDFELGYIHEECGL